MAGIYIHIPFCKQACHYCDFHFSTNLKKKDEMITALAKELAMRHSEFSDEIVETIYFGGGTPSVLSVKEIDFLIDAVEQNYRLCENPEITLEANPDDLSEAVIIALGKTKINRLSIGIQSFFEDDLKMMNRAHNAAQARKALSLATKYFENITIDLIYGIPGMSNQRWKENIATALAYKIPHISSYALTVEPKTALKKLIETGQVEKPKDELAESHFEILMHTLETVGFVHYELSNFGKPGFFSKNNSAYWLGKKYLGIGPSAHSYDGQTRSWNIANNTLYLKSIGENVLPQERELLSDNDRFNEYIMTGLRTIWGVSLLRIEEEFGQKNLGELLRRANRFVEKELLVVENQVLRTTPKGKFLADGLAADLFLTD